VVTVRVYIIMSFCAVGLALCCVCVAMCAMAMA
jgi:hypothetical protein